MNKPLEVLLDAKNTLEGKHGGDLESNVAGAVDYILQYLIAKEVAEEHHYLCSKIDKAQKVSNVNEAAQLMVERDKVLALIK